MDPQLVACSNRSILFFSNTRKFIKFYKAFYKHKATNFQKEEVEFKHDLEHAQRDLRNEIHDHDL